ncbi:hypothetical protein BASA50_005067 [Batrachochytrium salamandrivorans]|uniref:Uncharacterized protein n=1 Tax=Batrachochytrium salamandrivorans TaxID=1357716 RepID=A0ABQ8FF35_9FUNG|nr:hypothetical protein BASA50_005067 [Batrachochytrium salamandrivorans]KAH9272917.1 hypothetical protein BASA83_004809 [Batrachochytrium salamandrivorans]
MKLISFAVISLLAITVSAHKPKKSSDDKSALCRNQNVIEEKIQELEKDYKVKQEAVLKLGGLKAMGKKEQEAISVMEELEEELKKGFLPRDKKLDLIRQSNRALENWKCTRNILMAKQEILIKAMEQRSYAEMKISILEENIERQPDPDPNDESRDLMGASYDSNLPREILAEQIGEFCQDAADLLAAYDDIKVGIHKFDGVVDRTKNPKRRPGLLSTRNSVARPHNTLFDETKLAQCKCVYSKKFQVEFGWKPQSSRAKNVFKSFRKDTK